MAETLERSSPSFEIGLPWLDAHHRFFFDEFDRLAAAIRAGRGAERLPVSVESLARYAVFHFGSEENWMKDVGYPKAEAHRQEHVAFLAAMRGVDERLEREGPSGTLADEILLWMRAWLLEHIETFDRDVVRFEMSGASEESGERG